VILVDCGSALGEETLAASFSADRRLMVVTEELPAWIGARRRIGALRSLHIADPIAELVVNRHHPGHPASAEAIEKAVGVPVLGHVRNAWQDVHGALQERMVLAQVAPRSLAAVDIASLAELLAVPTRRTGWGRIAAAVGR